MTFRLSGHTAAGRYPDIVPAEAGNQFLYSWIPDRAALVRNDGFDDFCSCVKLSLYPSSLSYSLHPSPIPYNHPLIFHPSITSTVVRSFSCAVFVRGNVQTAGGAEAPHYIYLLLADLKVRTTLSFTHPSPITHCHRPLPVGNGLKPLPTGQGS